MRSPRTERATVLLHTLQTWLPGSAERLPLPTPTAPQAALWLAGFLWLTLDPNRSAAVRSAST
ncbi:hypothetical protein ACQPZQ_06250 [Pseudonocardia sp. CA-142604]|uniref:hypothetical protein n=1 Tax=Pseudonocardia sp. CA-142604 TaxID=3240024 RepID=UPI003D8C2A9D